MFFLGVDIGSLYTKLTVINDENKTVYSDVFRTMARNKKKRDEIIDKVNSDYKIVNICSTGYGRKFLKSANVIIPKLP